MFAKMKLGIRIILGFASLLILLGIMTILAIYSMNTINSKIATITKVNNAETTYAETMSKSVLQISRSINVIILVSDTETINAERNKIADNYRAYDEALNNIQMTGLSEQGDAIIAQISSNSGKCRPLISQVAMLGLTKDPQATNILIKKTAPAIDEWLKTLDEFEVLQEQSNKADAHVAEQTYYNSLMALFIFAVIAISFGIGVALFITRSITKPVNSVVDRLNDGAGQVAAASGHLSSAAGQLSQGSAEQASAIEETSSTLQESSSMLQQNTVNTKQAAQLAEQAKESANKGNLEMQQMMSSMEEIKKSSNQISKIIKVIDDIAFQTNILALNAAIEAARAGESGAGFAVVAEEVRNLAGRSAQAAKDTTMIIESNIEMSSKGVSVAERVREALTEITGQTKKVNELMAEISAASEEQAQGVEQVNKALAQMEMVTQQNAASAEESASASGNLSSQADSMKRIVQELSQIVNGAERVLKDDRGSTTGHKVHRLHFNFGHFTKLIRKDHTVQDSVHHEPQLNDNYHHEIAVEKTTKVISPEEVIPLEADPKRFK